MKTIKEQNKFTVNTNVIGRIFGKVINLFVTESAVEIIFKNKMSKQLLFKDFIDFPDVESGIFGNKIYLKYKGESYIISFLIKDESWRAVNTIVECVKQYVEENIQSVTGCLYSESVERFLRDSSVDDLDLSLRSVLSLYKENKQSWDNRLSKNALKDINYFIKVFPISKNKELIRRQYEKSTLNNRKYFYDKIESNPLTEQQRLAVIRNNDYNLVLAAAGTGKTSVMVAKALDLIETNQSTQEGVLILAYNNAAAKELKERVSLRSEKISISEEKLPRISTFHALGRYILKQAGINTNLSIFAEDPLKLKIWLTEWLSEYITADPSKMDDFINLNYQAINPFDFKSKEEYDVYVRDNEFRTLQGELVKGYQELLIANWMFLNGIEYEYEPVYVSKRRVEIGFDYRPDFLLIKTQSYLEHFGIDRKGNTRPGIDKQEYNETITKKRELHQECGTTIYETYHYNWVEDELEKELERIVNDDGLVIKRRSNDEILEKIKENGFFSRNIDRYMKCLQAIRTERLNTEEKIESRLYAKDILNAKKYSSFLNSLHCDYKKELLRQDRIDFDDMIIRAINVIKDGSYKPDWDNILVDEFQDISMSRMELLETLVSYGPAPCLTVVGDDWQSIYRFSGGKLELTTRFGERVGEHSLTKLEKTFRYNKSIADTAGEFIMKNPEQYKKNVVTHDNVSESQIYLLDSKVNGHNDLSKRVVQVIQTIRKNDPNGSIAILARYRYLLKDAKDAVSKTQNRENIKYWTFHGSKGLEADYCILVGFFQGKSGFPNENKDEAVVEALLPSLDTFPHSEERRLLYVAITRARKKLYLIADPMAPSDFVNEILSPKYKINIVSKTFEEKYRRIFKCPVCTSGYYILRTAQYGDFYSCTTGHTCRSKPRICEECGSPSIDLYNKSICNNIECKKEKVICDRCGRPMKVRDGRFGKFLGCSGYGIRDDQCKNTRKLGIFN